jgi:P27 family predicted phage terminase small subunit
MSTETEAPESEAEAAAEAPRFMALSGAASEIWNELFPGLRVANRVKAQDRNALARYCSYLARWVKLSAKVDAAGETYETESKHGKLQRINPDLNALLKIETVMLAIEDRYGLSPQSRLNILTKLASAGGQGAFDLPTAQPEGHASPAKSNEDDNVVTFPGIGAVPVRANA